MVNSGAMRFLQYHYIHKRLVNVCEFRIVIHKKYITAKPVPLKIAELLVYCKTALVKIQVTIIRILCNNNK